MSVSPYHHSAPLIRKIENVLTLTDEERMALVTLPMQVQAIRADQDLVREGDRPSRCFVLLDGFASTYKVTGGGKRQIQAWHIPGDVPDLQSLHLRVLDSSITTLTPSRVGFIHHAAVQDLCRRYPRLNDALWRDTLINASVFREWMINVGRREAYSRLAHVFCEWVLRLRAVGLADDHTCDLPMTQNELADATGVTTVHVNRVLQALRKGGLIELKGSKLKVLDWQRLREVGDFDAMYLHIEPPRAA